MKEKKNLFDQIKAIDEKERLAEEEKQKIQREKLLEREKIEQEEYNKRLQRERVEMMQLKQGVIAEPELVTEQQKIEKIYTPKEKISNFFYHNKLYLIIGTVAAVIVFFFIYDMVTAVHADANILFINTNAEISLMTSEIEEMFEQYGTDENDDGKVYISVSYMPIDDAASENYQEYQANNTKFIGEIQANDSVIIIGNNEVLEKMGMNEYLVDLRERYPDKDNVNERGIILSQTEFAEKLGISEPDDDIVICIQDIGENPKEKEISNYENTLSILDKLMDDIG